VGPTGAEVIGVLEDLSFEHPSAAVPPYLFFALSSVAAQRSAVVESDLTAKELRVELALRQALGELEFNVTDVRPLELLRAELIPADRARGYLTIASAVLVVLLATVGFYGMQRYLITAGRREYAIRASLGAGPRALRRLVFGRGLVLGSPGIAVGSLLAFIVVAYLRGDVVSREISPAVVTVWVAVVLVVLILGASLGPARQAGGTQPAPLLRED
jgi:ABC-type antimicrobial peptide transport system permease subunit